MKASEYLILLIFVLVFVGSLSLGIWQIDRGYDKKALENTFSQRQSLPVETNPGELNQNLYYRNIQISGIFSKKIIVSRGWIESDQRDSLPELSLPQTTIKLDGMIRPFSKDFVLEDQAKQITNNFIIQGLDKELMEDLSGYKFLPYVFELSALSNLSLEPIWRPTSLKSTRHFGYAIQWFALALVVLFGGYYLFRKKQST